VTEAVKLRIADCGLRIYGTHFGDSIRNPKSEIRNSRPPHWFDLQLFAAEDEGRTEEATSKRISKARGEGQVAKSQELSQVIGLYVGTLILMLILPRIVGYEMNHMRYILENLSTLNLSRASLQMHFVQIGIHLIAVIWPLALAEIVVSVGTSMAQVGWLFTWQPLQPKWNKIFPDPKKLIDRLLIGKTMAFNLAKSVVKIGVIGWIAWTVLSKHMGAIMGTWGMQPFQSTEFFIAIAYEMVWKICLFLAVVAAADYLFNRHQWQDSLKMKKEEVKDEARQSEGDPMVKQAQRKRMMQMARRRMMKEIPTADVVITNPTHFAVAIKYDQATMTAPRVIAKGEGFIALKIRQIAEQHGIPCVENKPLAQALYKGVEIGSEVPPQFYQAIAEVLAHVYRIRKKAS
jgi:flagellar biosynthesis protein FlhB